MRVLVFQHLAAEHPGRFRALMAADGAEWDCVYLDEGQPIPPLDGYDVLMVMGGAMDVWDVDVCPWLVDEKRAIRRWIRDLGRPYLGICLGHQLAADALGGTCGPLRKPEVGVMPVELTPEGLSDPLFDGMAARTTVLQWHGVQVAQPPEGAAVLATSPLCRVQALRFGPRAWGVQFHPEVEREAAAEWACVPQYQDSLEAVNGPGAMARLGADIETASPEFDANAQRLWRNFRRAMA